MSLKTVHVCDQCGKESEPTYQFYGFSFDCTYSSRPEYKHACSKECLATLLATANARIIEEFTRRSGLR